MSPTAQSCSGNAAGTFRSSRDSRQRLEANVCAPSYQCFTKFLRTPAVEGSKVGQIVQYEAASQVPFPLDEVEWGFEVMGTADTGELDVMLMALREEVIESLSTVCNDLGIRLSVVDGSPAALRNAFMQNYAEVEGVRCCWISAPKPPT